jgi:pre-mRNA-processing factor 17
MNFLSGYGSEEEEEAPIPQLSSSRVISNPIVSTTTLSVSLAGKNNVNNVPIIGKDMVVSTNPTMEVMFAAAEGPKHPFKHAGTDNSTSVRKLGMGYIENTTIDDTTFDDQYKSFLKSGYAVHAGNNSIVGDYEEYLKDNQPPQKKFKAQKLAERQSKQMMNIMNSIADEGCDGEEAGPWGAMPVGSSSSSALRKPAAADEDAVGDDAGEEEAGDSTTHILEPEEEDEMWEKVNERKRCPGQLPPRPARGSKATDASSTYHGPAANNTAVSSMNRSWVLPPLGIKPEDNTLVNSHDCFIPKKCIKKFSGHTKGVQCIELFPGTGHLCLSGGLDGKCKIWSLYDDSSDFGGAPGSGRGLRRTYSGHTEGVRSVDFNNSGEKFLSSSFDRYMRMWDVETGGVVATFGNRKMGYQAKFVPSNDNLFLMAASDNKVYQWDTRTGGVTLEYNYHLGPVNTITYFDDGNKFMTTSDDKKILVWEFDTPVPLKQIQDEGQQSIPTLTMHPSKTAIAGQSMDNSIVVYAAGDTVRSLFACVHIPFACSHSDC